MSSHPPQCCPNSPNVREVILGENGILDTAKTGTVVIDMSSTNTVESNRRDIAGHAISAALPPMAICIPALVFRTVKMTSMSWLLT